MNQEFPFIGGAYTARDKNLNAQVCQNYYVEVDETGAKNVISLAGCPGCKGWSDPDYPYEVRAMATFKNLLYAVIGDRLYEFSTDGSYSNLGTLKSSEGWVDLVPGYFYLGIYESKTGWAWDGVTLSEITSTGLPSELSGATYQDGYHIVSRANTGQFFISSQDDPTTWDATDFAEAEGAGDILLSPMSVQRQLWLIGKKTTEIWFNAGETFPFVRNPGGFLSVGCNAKRSISTTSDQLMWLDDRNRVVMAQGLQVVSASTYQIDYLISTFSRTDDAIGFMYVQEGHTFYELSFPAANKTICYDLKTGFWHTRASGGDDGRCIANCSAPFDNKVLVGDATNGKIYEYDLATYTDDGEVKRAIRACQHINNNGQVTFYNSLQLDMDTGVGDATTADPQIMLQWSDDGGDTWSNEHWKALGASGDRSTRVKWNRLGKSRDRIFRTIVSDPVKRSITKAYLDGAVGNA